MLVFDQLKKNDAQLRLLSAAVLAGLCVLLAGLWWVQIVSAQDYQQHLETQAFRTVRMPAVRGKILDRNGVILAENQPSYSVSLYLDDLRDDFQKEYTRIRPVDVVTNSPPFWKFWNRSRSVVTNRAKLKKEQIDALAWQARYNAASNVVALVSKRLQMPLTLNFTNFADHYENRLALPYPVVANLDPTLIARFEEQSDLTNGVDLEIQSARSYPFESTAAHLLGHVVRDNSSMEGEESYFTYRLPDYRGAVGIETNCEKDLHGHAGAKSVLVNNQGYRQTENILEPAEPGKNVVLTIDVRIQEAAEQALKSKAPTMRGGIPRGAVVVMDVHTGDVLAMASSPTFSPQQFVPGISTADYRQIQELDAERNRATQGQYQAGSTFKTVVTLAALENGLNPKEEYRVEPNPERPDHGMIRIGNQMFRDTAVPGDYDLRRALVRSSNSYFITNGLKRGVFPRVIDLGHQLHLGERIILGLAQEAGGHFPSAERVRGWTAGNCANICIGQGEMDVTPMQMAVVTCALANYGEVLRPRLVDRIIPQDVTGAEPPVVFPKHVVRNVLKVSRRSFDILHECMLAETEDPIEGTGRPARVAGLRICGKTGTAERMDLGVKKNTTWFISFAPYENPKYAVVIAVEDGLSGGGTCAPVAKDVYEAILKAEQKPAENPGSRAASNPPSPPGPRPST
jgi:penicillin-binding protein 2